MLTERWHLVSAFAGGCLCTGVAVAVLTSGEEQAPRTTTEGRVAPPVATAAVPSDAPDDTPSDDVPAAPPALAATPAEPTESGRSLADVLAQLEATYRAGLPAPVQLPAPVSEPAPSVVATQPLAPEPTASPPPALALPTPAPAPSQAPAPVAVARADAPPAAPFAPTVAQPLATDAERAAREREMRDRDAYVFSVYQAELYQQQQLAMLQYLALIAAQTGNAPPAPAGPVRPGTTPRRSPTFTFPLTNPSNPWGFAQPPAVLAK